MSELPKVEEWKSLSDKSKAEITRSWSPYTKDIKELVEQILFDFKKSFQNIPNLKILGLGNKHGSLVITVTTPFHFDRRLLPNSFQGVYVTNFGTVLPDDFKIYEQYVWAPENYEDYVDKHIEDIRKDLMSSNMKKEEILHALIGKPFNEWVDYCRKENLTGRYG